MEKLFYKPEIKPAKTREVVLKAHQNRIIINTGINPKKSAKLNTKVTLKKKSAKKYNIPLLIFVFILFSGSFASIIFFQKVIIQFENKYLKKPLKSFYQTQLKTFFVVEKVSQSKGTNLGGAVATENYSEAEIQSAAAQVIKENVEQENIVEEQIIETETVNYAEADQTIKFMGIGDFMPGIVSNDPKYAQPKAELVKSMSLFKQYTQQADISFLNLEGTLIDKHKPVKCNDINRDKSCYEFGMPESTATFIKDSGFNVVSLNNNHVMDYGYKGFNNTKAILDEKQIKYTGQIGDIAGLEIKQKKIAVIGFGFLLSHKFYSIINLEKSKKIIHELKKNYDLVIVSFHGGAEGAGQQHVKDRNEIFYGHNRGNILKFARTSIDAGADAVIGHGPHVPRAFELYKNKIIIYSLGNFFTYGKFSLAKAQSYAPMVFMELDPNNGNFVRGKIIPFIQKGRGVPDYDKKGKVVKFIKEVSQKDFPDNPLEINQDGNLYIR